MDKIDEILENFNDMNTERTFDSNEISKNSIFAILAYLIPILFFLPFITDKNSAYCKFHANESFLWLITLIVLGVVCGIIGLIPIIGFIVKRIAFPLIVLGIDFAMVYGSIKGKAYRLPFVGSLFEIF